MDKIKLLGEETILNIKKIQDFQVFTGHSYDVYSKMVKLGHLKGSVYNTQTKTDLSKEEMSKILLCYLDNELQQIVFYEIVACFDYFIESLSKIKKISQDSKFHIKLKTLVGVEDYILRLNEIRNTRHCFAHKSGIIDKEYVDRCGKFSRGKIGDKLAMDRPYTYDSINFIKKMVIELVSKV